MARGGNRGTAQQSDLPIWKGTEESAQQPTVPAFREHLRGAGHEPLGGPTALRATSRAQAPRARSLPRRSPRPPPPLLPEPTWPVRGIEAVCRGPGPVVQLAGAFPGRARATEPTTVSMGGTSRCLSLSIKNQYILKREKSVFLKDCFQEK